MSRPFDELRKKMSPDARARAEQRREELSPPDRLQCLITGVYRTGSTYLALLLNNHPDLAVGLHTTNWPRERHGAGPFGMLKAIGYARDRWGLMPIEGHTGSMFESEPVAWHETMMSLFGSPRWAEKVNLEHRFIPTFLDWFPDTGRAIHIIRDPRSVMASFKAYTYTPEPSYLGAAFNCLDAMRSAVLLDDDEWVDSTGFWEAVRHVSVRYEDVVSNTVGSLGWLVRWLGLDWPRDYVMLSTDGWQDVPGSRWRDRSSFGRVDETFDVDAAVNRWRGMDEKDRAFCETICGDEMGRWGYGERVYEMDEGQLRDMVGDDAQLTGWLDHWLETGEGSCGFPLDPDDSDTWRENMENAGAVG